MLVGVDTYTFHRHLGDVRPDEARPDRAWGADELLDTVTDIGADAVAYETMFLPALDSSEWSRVAERIRTGPTPVLCWGGYAGFDGGRRADAMPDLIGWLGAAREIGAPLVRMVVGGPPTRQETTFEERLSRLPALVAEAAAVAAERGVRLAIETHADNTIEELLAIIAQAHDPDVPDPEIVLDAANLVRVGDDPVAAARLAAGRTAMAHLRDLRRSDGPYAYRDGAPCYPPGSGDLPLREFVQVLIDGGFDGLLAVEYVRLAPEWPDEVNATRAGLATLRGWVSSTAVPAS